MSYFSQLFGAGGSVPLGAIVSGHLRTDPNYLPCDGRDYLAANYPDLDKTGLASHGDLGLAVVKPIATNTLYAYALAASPNRIVLLYNSGTAYATSDDDGLTWTSRVLPGATANVPQLAYGNGVFVMQLGTVNSTSTVYTSADGLNWTARTTGLAQNNQRAACCLRYVNGLFYLFMSDTSAMPVYFATSPDGITWTLRLLAEAAAFISDLSYGDGVYVASVVNSYAGGATYALHTSGDGINFTPMASLWTGVGTATTYSAMNVGGYSIEHFNGAWFLCWGSYLTVSRDLRTFMTVNSGIASSNNSGNGAGAQSPYVLGKGNGMLYSLAVGRINASYDGLTAKNKNAGQGVVPYLQASYSTSKPVITAAGTLLTVSGADPSGAVIRLPLDPSKFRTPKAPAASAACPGDDIAWRTYLRVKV